MADTLTTPEDALAKRTQLPPALVEEIQENPEAIRPLARGMAAINLFNLFAKVSHPNASTKDKLEFQTLAQKLGGMEVKVSESQGAGPQVVINITRAKDDTKAVIEGVSVTVPEPVPDGA